MTTRLWHRTLDGNKSSVATPNPPRLTHALGRFTLGDVGVRWVAFIGSILAAACGGRSYDQKDGGADAPRDDAGPSGQDASAGDCGGLYEFDCPEGLRCFGPPICGAPWSCQEELPPCSAAPPISVCGCDGFVGAVPAGCLERYAWRLDGFPPTEYGAPCDGSLSQPPASVTLRLELRAFDGFHEYQVRLSDGAAQAGMIQNGSATVVFRDVPGWDFYWVDIFAGGGDPARCVQGVDLVGIVYPNRFDALAMVATYEIEPADLVYPCADWGG